MIKVEVKKKRLVTKRKMDYKLKRKRKKKKGLIIISKGEVVIKKKGKRTEGESWFYVWNI